MADPFATALQAQIIDGMSPMTQFVRHTAQGQIDQQKFELGKAKRLECKELIKDIAQLTAEKADQSVIDAFKRMLESYSASI